MSCSGLERSEKAKIKSLNVQKEKITRSEDDIAYHLVTPKKRGAKAYFWGNKVASNLPKITKEYFRCKGSYKNPPIHLHKNSSNEKYLLDCNGFDEHSLPVKDEKEYIYPALIELLNYVQENSLKQVVITCGHRCPKHNLYTEINATRSKHLIGAEVDFYVLGLQAQIGNVVEIIKKYYENRHKEYGPLVNTTSNSFENKEIRLKVRSSKEQKDLDNQHPYPYITIELKYDRDTKKAVHYSWKISHQSVMKW